jgi:hypothetical protein
MTRFAINAVLFFAVAGMIAIQFDPMEGHLINGYAGLRWTMLASAAMGFANFIGLAYLTFKPDMVD